MRKLLHRPQKSITYSQVEFIANRCYPTICKMTLKSHYSLAGLFIIYRREQTIDYETLRECGVSYYRYIHHNIRALIHSLNTVGQFWHALSLSKHRGVAHPCWFAFVYANFKSRNTQDSSMMVSLVPARFERATKSSMRIASQHKLVKT